LNLHTLVSVQPPANKTTTMKIFASLMTALLLFGASLPTARADATVDIDYFYDALSPYGDWVQVEGYGYAFQPFVTVEDPEWRPYTDGQWAYTDAGWTWVTNEDFGWATYHYGRWMKAGSVWLWLPGNEWAPAWVSWRSSPEYVGWAPLPPEAVWQQDVGFSVAVDTTYDIGPSYYSFVPIRFFGAPRLRTYVEPWHRNVDYMRRTDNCTHITYRQGDVRMRNIFIGGPDYVEINRYSERPLRRMTLHRDDSFDPNVRGSRRTREDGDSLFMAAPSVTIGERKAPSADKVKARLDKSAVDRGWRGIKAEDAGSVREKLKREVVEAKTRPGRGGPPDAGAGADALRNRERGPDSTVAPGTPGEHAPKALPATPDEISRAPGTDTPGRGDRPPGMRRPGEDGSAARVPGRPGDDTPPGPRGPRRPGETDELNKERGPGKGPDSSNRGRTPDAIDRTPVGPGPGTAPEMKPKDDDNRGKPEGRRSNREGEDARPGPGNGSGNTVSPVVPRPGGVPPEANRKIAPPTEHKPDVKPGEGPDHRGRSARPDSSPNENAIPKPDRTPKPGNAERKIDRTPDTPPAPRNVAPPVAPVPVPRPEARKPEQPREEMRHRPEAANEAQRPHKVEKPEAPKPQQVQRPEPAPRPQGGPGGPNPAAGGGGAHKEKGDKKDDDDKEKGKHGR
jgi:hypothetical protein